MEYIDTHTHNSDEAFRGEEDAIIDKCSRAGVTMMLQPDIDSGERSAMLSLVDRHKGLLRPMLGLYPGSVDAGWREEIDAMTPYFSRSDIAAVGEIGLDYHFSTEFAAEQQEALRVQLDIALDKKLPVNIHLRDATEDFFKVLEDYKGRGLRGNIHAFSGSIETFTRLQRYGDWFVGIGGIVTFKKSRLPQTLKDIPTDRILLETDSPYMAPVPLRGSRNDSSNLPIIVDAIAAAKNLDREEAASISSHNARNLFNLCI